MKQKNYENINPEQLEALRRYSDADKIEDAVRKYSDVGLPIPLIQNFFPYIDINEYEKLCEVKSKKDTVYIIQKIFHKIEKKFFLNNIPDPPPYIPKEIFRHLYKSNITLKSLLKWNSLMKKEIPKLEAARIALKNKKLNSKDLKYIYQFMSWQEQHITKK